MRRLLMVISVLVMVTLACRVVSQTATPTPIPTSTEVVGTMINKLETAVNQANSTGEFSLSITQVELTSLIASQLQSQGSVQFADPQVILVNNQIQLTGKYYQDNLAVNVRALIRPQVTVDGSLDLVLDDLRLGPFPAPNQLNQRFQEILDQAAPSLLKETVGPGVVVSDVTITDGVITITGRKP